jgi:hypothetical protein
LFYFLFLAGGRSNDFELICKKVYSQCTVVAGPPALLCLPLSISSLYWWKNCLLTMAHAIMRTTCRTELLSLGNGIKSVKGVFCRGVAEMISVVTSM